MLYRALKEISRAQLYDIWLKAKAAEPFDSEEDENIAQSMLEHVEYHHIWERLDEAKNDDVIENGVDTALHVIVHATIENQMSQNNPPEVQKALEGLLKRGATRHEAIHAIAYEFNMELYKTLRLSMPFNNIAYKRRLEKLAGKRR